MSIKSGTLQRRGRGGRHRPARRASTAFSPASPPRPGAATNSTAGAGPAAAAGFTATTLSGQQLTVPGGKPSVLFFFSVNCGTCGPGAQALAQAQQAAAALLGGILAVGGIAMLLGRRIPLRLPTRRSGPPRQGPTGMIAFGAGYSLCRLSPQQADSQRRRNGADLGGDWVGSHRATCRFSGRTRMTRRWAAA
jgi:hypothetical protein